MLSQPHCEARRFVKMAKKKTPGKTQAGKPVFQFVFPQYEIPAFYINNAQFATSDFDMRIDLGEVLETTPGDDGSTQIKVQPKVRIFMSLPFAFRFIVAMQQQIVTTNA